MGLILASGSPRRRALLTTCGISLKAILPSCVEEHRAASESPKSYCSRLAKEKALAVAAICRTKSPSDWVLAADTVVSMNNNIYEKPADDKDAFSMLKALSSGWHEVHSAWFLLKSDESIFEHGISTSEVRFRPLTDDEIRTYIHTGEGRDKAGSYGIQGLGAALVQEIKGSYSNIVGLPVHNVVSALRKHGLTPDAQKRERHG